MIIAFIWSYELIHPPVFAVPVLGGNPFAARPSLKSDVVSTAGPNQSVGPSNQAKFILRPSALSSQPHNRAEAGKCFLTKLLSTVAAFIGDRNYPVAPNVTGTVAQW